MKPKLKTILEELLQGLKALYGERLAKLILFGSQARGDAQEYSDIDIMIVLKGEVERRQEYKRSENVVWKLSLENDVVISCLYISEDRFLSDQISSLLGNIKREGLIVYE